MKVLLLDNFDSFTYNLYDYICQLGHKCSVIRNDASALPAISKYSDAIVLSPGPGRPEKAGVLMEVIEAVYKVKPVLGICLGHQALGMHYGMEIKKAEVPMHGIPGRIVCEDHPLLEGIDKNAEVMRYHSLILDRAECEEFDIIARSEKGEIMMMQHKELPLTGMQFHPESILTPDGLKLLSNWFRLYT